MLLLSLKSLNPENSERNIEIEHQKINSMKYVQIHRNSPSVGIFDYSETIRGFKKVQSKKQSNHEFHVNILKTERKCFQQTILEEEKFQNLFQGCKNWKISVPKVSLKFAIQAQANFEHIFSLSQKMNAFDEYNHPVDKQSMQSWIQDEIDSYILEYDDEQLFDTDCFVYERELLQQTKFNCISQD